MRLTKFHKQTFVRGVINDVPVEELNTLPQREAVIRRAAAAMVPAPLKEFYDAHPEYADYFVYHSRYVSGGGYISKLLGPEKSFPRDVKDEVDRLYALQHRSLDNRNKLEADLRSAVEGITTLAKLKEAFPQFLKFMPEDTTPPKTANLPVVMAKELTEKLVAAGLKLPDPPNPLPDFIIDEVPVPIPPETADQEGR